VKYHMIDRWRDRPVSGRKRANQRLLARIRELHGQSNGVFGSSRIWEELRYRGGCRSRNRVQPISQLDERQEAPGTFRFRGLKW
jgi:putative transposase